MLCRGVMILMDNYLNYDADKLKRFIDAVNDDVDKDAGRILGDAERKKSEQLEEVREETKILTEAKISDSEKKIRSKYMKLAAKAELDGKKAVLMERERLTQQVFENVRQKLIDFTNTPDYVDYLVKTAKSEHIRSGGVICLRPEDMKYSPEIEKALTVFCSFKEDASIKIGGLSVLYEKNGVIDDKTLDGELEDAKTNFHGSFDLAR